MDNRTTCAIFTSNRYGESSGYMCKHCSGVQFDAEKNQYWKCNKYNIRLNEDQNKHLVRCSKCIEIGMNE